MSIEVVKFQFLKSLIFGQETWYDWLKLQIPKMSRKLQEQVEILAVRMSLITNVIQSLENVFLMELISPSFLQHEMYYDGLLVVSAVLDWYKTCIMCK